MSNRRRGPDLPGPFTIGCKEPIMFIFITRQVREHPELDEVREAWRREPTRKELAAEAQRYEALAQWEREHGGPISGTVIARDFELAASGLWAAATQLYIEELEGGA